MSRTSMLVVILGGTVVFLAATEPAKKILLPASAMIQDHRDLRDAVSGTDDPSSNGSFEQRLQEMQADIRAAHNRQLPEEMRRLSNDLNDIANDILHMASDYQRLEDIGWKMSILSRKIETAQGRMKRISLSAPKNPDIVTPAKDLLFKAHDLVMECRRLEIQEPLIQDRIGFSQDSLDFKAEVSAAKENSARIEEEARSLLSRIQ